MINEQLSAEKKQEFLEVLKQRFHKNMHRHQNIEWLPIQQKLAQQPAKMLSLYSMEITDGEPDVISWDKKSNEYLFIDCSKESPKGRRSLCYDQEALEARKKFKPKDNVISLAKNMGVELLREEQYQQTSAARKR